MAVAVHFLLVICVWTSSLGVARAGLADAATPTSGRPIELVALSASQREVVSHAVRLFDMAALPLPALVVRGSRDPAACDGHDGLHRPHQERSEIILCSATADEWFRRVVLHELAHAWSTIGLTDERRHAFRVLRGWEQWSNYDLAAWRDNGAEQAAEVIAWGLSDKATPTVQIDHDSCRELLTGYVVLTGVEPLHGLTSLCSVRASQIERL